METVLYLMNSKLYMTFHVVISSLIHIQSSRETSNKP